MSYNEAALARSRETLARRREANARELERRTSLVYRRAPRVAEIDAALRRQMARLCALAFSRKAGAASEVESLRRENLALQAEREEILAGLGLDAGYLDEIYSCAICRDTGYVDGAMCECLRREYKAELTRELSGLLRDDGETFEIFYIIAKYQMLTADLLVRLWSMYLMPAAHMQKNSLTPRPALSSAADPASARPSSRPV